MEVKPEATQLDDGTYEGVISRIEYRETPYEYTDIYVMVGGKKEVKVGYPTFLSPTSGLGCMLDRLGFKLEVGKEIDIEKFLIDKHVQFISMQQKSKKDGTMYARILPDSVKLAK